MTHEELAHRPDRDIAVIGMAGRFPGARNIEAFWRNLVEGRESVRAFSDEELLSAGVSRALFERPDYVKAGTVLDDADLFDASFFGFSPREAEVIDPQQRVFLECVWEVLESAGYDPDRAEARIGLYAGAGHNTYMQNVLSNRDVMATVSHYQALLGSDRSFFTTRACYKLDLTGPSFSLQAACSTSLVAVHLACQQLQGYECDMALAGGASITFPQHAGYLHQPGMILSPDGHCRPFDVDAKGTVAGKGVGVVLLKRLEEAIADGDTIHAVIKASAVNNDGASKVGFTAPSVDGQAEVIAEALAKAELDADAMGYIEAHGTGTELGDPIEIAALTEVFRSSTDRVGFCAIGSLKSNVGHMDAAAGIGGLIKAILAVKHGKIPPSLNFRAPNPELELGTSPFFVNTELRDWTEDGRPRRAGVSAFGIGGANAHVIVEEPPARSRETEPVEGRPRPYLLVLSAKTEAACDRSAENLAAHLEERASDPLSPPLGDVAFTLASGRRPFPFRRFVVASTAGEAAEALRSRSHHVGRARSEVSRAVFLFPGQGAQYASMGAELYRAEPLFKEALDRCCDLLLSSVGRDLRELLLADETERETADAALRETSLTQPALFAVSYALASLLRSWGIEPVAMMGHSIGEYVAACLAGVFSLEDGLRLVAERGRLMQSVARGGMSAVPLPERDVRERLPEALSIAALNQAALTVVSGPLPALEAFERALLSEGVECRRLQTSHAFHSDMMDSILEAFATAFEGIPLSRPTIPFVSNVTGTWIRDEEATSPDYWVRHLREPVRFADGVATLIEDPSAVLVEVGPGTALTSLARAVLGSAGTKRAVSTMAHPRKREPGTGAAVLLDAVGRLWLSGLSPDWKRFYAGASHRRVPLPTYPFERRRFWVEAQAATPVSAFDVETSSSRKRDDISRWFYLPMFRETPPAELLRECPSPGRWLVLQDHQGLGERIAEEVRRRGGRVTVVKQAESYSVPTGSDEAATFTMDPRASEHYAKLFDDLEAAGAFPDTIVHLFSFGQELDFEAGRALGFESLLFLAKAVSASPEARIDLALVSDHLHDVTGDEPLRAEKALALGAGLVLSQESPGLAFASYDLDGSVGPRELVSDIASLVSGDSIAYRRGRRWIREHEAIRVEPRSVPENAPSDALRDGGVYLVTGGLGNVGLAVARWLAASSRARLVLLGRSGLPNREQWDRVVADRGTADPVASRIARVLELESLGAEVVVESADVSDETAMRGVLDRLLARFGRLDGVVHAAAHLGGNTLRPLRELSLSDCDAQFGPKVLGTLVLRKLVSKLPLDFVVVTSSLSTVLGGLGFGAYAASNLFLDTLASDANRDSGTRWIAIDWDGWDFSLTSKIGAAEYAMAPAEGIETLRRVLETPRLDRVVVSTGDLQVRLEAFVAPKNRGKGSSAAGSSSASQLHPRPALSDSYVAPRDETEQVIAGMWQDLLGIESIGIHDNFFDLGGHSLLATQVIARLRSSFQVELPLRAMFEASTVAELAERVKTVIWADKGKDADVSDESIVRQEIEI